MKGSLHHRIPAWVSRGARFHIRIRIEAISPVRLTDSCIAPVLLSAADFYHDQQRWFLHLFVLMPDHLHGILSFPADTGMSRTVGSWKTYVARNTGVRWQRNYFDHRLRNEEEFIKKTTYIRMNPARAGLCIQASDWPWILDKNA